MAAVLTVLSVAPGLLIMVTSFTRFTVALSFLRSGLGLQSAPANLVLISLSLFMTFFVMAPTFDKAWRDGLQPMMDNAISQEQAFGAITAAVPRIHARPGAREGHRAVRGPVARQFRGQPTAPRSTCAS